MAPDTAPMEAPPMAPKAKAFNNALCSCPSSPDISVATSAMKSSTPSWAASVVPSIREAARACPTAAFATLFSTPSAISLSVTFLSVVFLNRTGNKGLRPKAIEATSKAATMAPPVMAVPGASKPSPARAFISRSISPVLSIKEGRKAPKAPPTIPPTTLAPSIGIGAAASAPALAPAIAVGMETAMEGIIWAIPCLIKVKVSSQSSTSSTPRGRPCLAICLSLTAIPRLPTSISLSESKVSPSTRTPAQPLA